MKKYYMLMLIIIIFCNTTYASEDKQDDPEYKGIKLSQWLEELGSDDLSIMANAMLTIGDIGKAGTPMFRKFLKSPNKIIRKGAARALCIVPDKSAVADLIQVLRDKDIDVRAEAANALGEIKDNAAVKPLISLLDDEEVLARSYAAYALAKINDKAAVNPIMNLLKDESAIVRHSAIEALGYMKSKPAVPQLIALLKDEELFVRRATAMALGKIGDKSAVQSLVDVLTMQDIRLLKDAAEALGDIGDIKSIPAIRAALLKNQSDNDDIGLALNFALCKMGDSMARKILIMALTNEDSNKRYEATVLLGKTNDKTVVPMLIDVLINDDSQSIKRCAMKSLERLTHENFGKNVAQWQGWWEANKDRILKEEAEKEKPEKDKDEVKENDKT